MPHVQRYRAFTLIEMLAVVSIMLILLGVTFGILSDLAQQTGPETVLATVQAMIHNARDYAVGNGVPTRVEFRVTAPGGNDQLPSTTMTLQYWAADFGSGEWIDVPGRDTVALPRGIYVCKGFPPSLPASPGVARIATDVTDQEMQKWREYEQEVMDHVANFVMSSSGQVDTTHDGYYIVYGAEGYPLVDSARLTPLSMQPTEVVGSGQNDTPGLTVVRVSGVSVSGYTFYLWNQNAGTRLIFR